MKKTKSTIPTYFFLILFVIFIVGIILGSFYDLNISKAIASADGTNPFGMFFETIGSIPSYMTIGLAGSLMGVGILSLAKQQEKKGLKIFLTILGVLVIVGPVLFGTYMLGNQLNGQQKDAPGTFDNYGYRIPSKIASMAVAFVLQASTFPFAYFVLDREKGEKMLKIGIIIAFTALLQWLIIHFSKGFAGRPRFRFLFGDMGGVYEGNHYYYQEWYAFAWTNPKSVDIFKSFPSGHSGITTVLLGLAYLPLIAKKRFKFDTRIIFIVATVYSFVMYLARILAGAHYLSDTAMGGLIATFALFLGSFIMERFVGYGDKPKQESPEIPAEAPAK